MTPNNSLERPGKEAAMNTEIIMNSRASKGTKLKAFIVVEFIALLIALVLPVIPKKGGGDLINLPSDAASYFESVLVSFAIGNGVLLILAATVWVYWISRGRPALPEEESAPLDS